MNKLSKIVLLGLIFLLFANALPVSANEANYEVKMVLACGNFSVALMSDGTLVGWGNNQAGQLGNGLTEMKTKPFVIMSDVESIATGGTNLITTEFSHLLIIKKDGSLWACGANENGELGDGTEETRTRPIMIMKDVKMVSTAWCSSVALKNDGSVWIWGDTGYVDRQNQYKPYKVMDDALSVATGGGSIFVIKNDNLLWAFGSNFKNQLGIDGERDICTPTMVMDGVKSIIPGQYYTMAIKIDHSLWGWGDNLFGRLGIGETNCSKVPVKIMDEVKEVATGGMHTLAIKKDGTLYAWGNNYCGQLGNGTQQESRKPVEIMKNVKQVSAGNRHSIVLTQDNKIYVFGDNESNQLGIEEDGELARANTPQLLVFDEEIFNKTPANIFIKINGEYINTNDVSLLVDNRVLVPFRAIFEALGASVSLDGQKYVVKVISMLFK